MGTTCRWRYVLVHCRHGQAAQYWAALMNTALYEVLCEHPRPRPTAAGGGRDCTHARPANASMDITGLPGFFDGQRFASNWKGPQKAVLKLMERIGDDTRHVNVELVHHGLLEARRFQGSSAWHSAP